MKHTLINLGIVPLFLYKWLYEASRKVTNLFAALGHTRARYFIGRYQRTMLICDVSALSCALSLWEQYHRSVLSLIWPPAVHRARDKDKAPSDTDKAAQQSVCLGEFCFAKSEGERALLADRE